MELRHVRYFLAVAEERNFTRAAAKVGIGQPPLSQQIRDLEREVGAALFRRLSHGVELTVVGEAFLPEARTLVAQAERAKTVAQRAAQGLAGELRIGFTGSAAFHPLVPGVLRAFRAAYPDVALSLREEDTERLLRHLAEGAIDVAFVRLGPGDPEGVRVRRAFAEPMRVVVPEDHPLAGREAVGLAELAPETIVLFPRLAGRGLFDETVGACRRAGIEPNLGPEAPQLTSVGNLVAAGLGISIVPASVAQVGVPGVVALPIAGEAPIVRLAVATRRESGPGSRAAIVANFLRRVEPSASEKP